MSRLPGFLWSWPNFQSIAVPYHDTNDFYYSGHISNSMLYSSEFWAMKWKKYAAFTMFSIINVWITLTFLYTHYVIDFTTGVCVGRLVFRWGEKLTYYVDVKIFGSRR